MVVVVVVGFCYGTCLPFASSTFQAGAWILVEVGLALVLVSVSSYAVLTVWIDYVFFDVVACVRRLFAANTPGSTLLLS